MSHQPYTAPHLGRAVAITYHPPMQQRVRSTRHYTLLALKAFAVTTVLGSCLALVAATSRLFLQQQSLRLDEAQSLWQSSHTVGGLLRTVANDVHVPLYHLLLHFWQLAFGNGIDTVRQLSLLFLLASIPLVYLLARRVLSYPWALFATFMFSLSPFVNWYGSETRMYTLLAFMSLLSHLFFLNILQKNRGWLGYGLTAIVGIYSHYFFAFTLIAQAIFFVAYRKDFAPGSLRKFAIVAGTTFAAFAPWLYYFRMLGSASNTTPGLPVPSSVDFFNAFSQFSFGFQSQQINTILLSCWPLLTLFGFFAIRKNQRFNNGVTYLVSAAFIPVILAFVLSFVVKPFFLSRYMISVVAPLTIVMIWFISHYQRKFSLLAAGVLTLSLLLASYQQIRSYATPVKENYAGAAEFIESNAKPQDIVVLSAPFTVYPFEYYYQGHAKLTTLPHWERRATGAIPPFEKDKLPAQTAVLHSGHRYVYLLLSQDQGYEKDIRDYYEKNFQRKDKKSYSPGLTLYVYQVGYTTVTPISELP